MTILRSGATKKYSENWSKAFGGGKKKATKKVAKKKTTSKSKKKTKKGFCVNLYEAAT